MTGRVIVVRGDAGQPPLGDGSVDLVLTSPPYWGLRSYEDGEGVPVPGQHGAEPSVADYVDTLVDATAAWLRALKPGGSVWVNLGDRYTGSHPRSLALLPARYAIAVADRLNLVVRQEVIWSKPSAMPERPSDRCVRSHEVLIHLVRRDGCIADLTPLRSPRRTGSPTVGHRPRTVPGQPDHGWTSAGHPDGVVPGSVWTIPSEPLRLPEHLGHPAHPAPMPTEIARRVVLGWSPAGGVVWDPYGGSGTVAHVAAALGRTGVTTDLSAAYSALAADPQMQARRARKVSTGTPGGWGSPTPPGQACLWDDAVA